MSATSAEKPRLIFLIVSPEGRYRMSSAPGARLTFESIHRCMGYNDANPRITMMADLQPFIAMPPQTRERVPTCHYALETIESFEAPPSKDGDRCREQDRDIDYCVERRRKRHLHRNDEPVTRFGDVTK